MWLLSECSQLFTYRDLQGLVVLVSASILPLFRFLDRTPNFNEIVFQICLGILFSISRAFITISIVEFHADHQLIVAMSLVLGTAFIRRLVLGKGMAWARWAMVMLSSLGLGMMMSAHVNVPNR
jgi:hypothetical protein